MSQGFETIGEGFPPEEAISQIRDIDFTVIQEAGRIAARAWNKTEDTSVALARTERSDTDTCMPDLTEAVGCDATDDCTVVPTCEDVTNEGTCYDNTCDAGCDE